MCQQLLPLAQLLLQCRNSRHLISVAAVEAIVDAVHVQNINLRWYSCHVNAWRKRLQRFAAVLQAWATRLTPGPAGEAAAERTGVFWPTSLMLSIKAATFS